MRTRRDRLRGHRFSPAGGITAEVRRACRNELKIVYEGSRFPLSAWEALAGVGRLEVFHASRLNPAMKDLMRVRGPGLSLEGAEGGQVLIARYEPPTKARARHAVEAVLRAYFGTP